MNKRVAFVFAALCMQSAASEHNALSLSYFLAHLSRSISEFHIVLSQEIYDDQEIMNNAQVLLLDPDFKKKIIRKVEADTVMHSLLADLEAVRARKKLSLVDLRRLKRRAQMIPNFAYVKKLQIPTRELKHAIITDLDKIMRVFGSEDDLSYTAMKPTQKLAATLHNLGNLLALRIALRQTIKYDNTDLNSIKELHQGINNVCDLDLPRLFAEHPSNTNTAIALFHELITGIPPAIKLPMGLTVDDFKQFIAQELQEISKKQ